MKDQILRAAKVMELWAQVFDTRFKLAKDIVSEIEVIQLDHATLASKIEEGQKNLKNLDFDNWVGEFEEWAKRFQEMKIRMEGIMEGKALNKRSLKRSSSDAMLNDTPASSSNARPIALD